MDPPLNIGFSDHVISDSPPGRPHVPQFPAPLGFHHVTPTPVNTFLTGSAPPGAFGSAPPGAFGSAPPGAFDSAPPGAFGSAPHGAFGSAPHGVFGSAPPGAFGSDPPGAFGSAHPGAFGSAPPGAFGSAPPGAFGSAPPGALGSAPPGALGSAPPGALGSAPPGALGSAPPGALGSVPPGALGSAPPAPYGFLSNNWIEERQSWFPVAPPLCGEDSVGEESLPAAGGLRIGFEDYGVVSDPTAHYHHMDRPAGGDVWSRRISPSPFTWPGDQGRSSVYGATQDRQPENVTVSGTFDWRIRLRGAPGRREPEVAAFCEAVCSIRRGYSATDPTTNSGRIWSVAIPFPDDITDSEVEISVIGGDGCKVLQTVQRDSVHVGDLVRDILWRIQDPAASAPPPAPLYPSHDLYPQSHDTPRLYPSLQPPVTPSAPGEEAGPARNGCHLTICGLDEYLQPGRSLRSHVVLQGQRSIGLRLYTGGDPRGPLARTVEDDQAELRLGDWLEHAQYWEELRKRVFGAVAHYEDQVQSFLHNRSLGVSGVLAAVEEICYLLRSVETQEISDSVQKLKAAELQQRTDWTQSPEMADPVARALVEVSGALSGLLSIYSRSFPTDFAVDSCRGRSRMEDGSGTLSFRLFAAHNLPENWTKSGGLFYVAVSLLYAGRKICPEVKSRNVPSSRSFFCRAIWDETIRFPVPRCALPYESLLVLRLYTITATKPAGSFLAWTCLPVYNNQQMVRGELLINMVSHAEPPAVITPTALDASVPTLITMQVDFWGPDVIFQRPGAELMSCDAGGEDVVWRLHYMANRCSVLLLSEADRQSLWYYRRCPRPPPHLLPLLLGSAPSWDPLSISAMYRVLEDWTFSGPLEALGLLSPCFADEKIRGVACRELERLSCDQLLELLPQLVQAVKYERSLNSDLVRLLLHRALQSIQVAHRLYWLLTDASSEPHYRGLYRRLLETVQRCAGRSLSDEFSKQRRLLQILEDTAGRVKSAPEDKRQEALRFGLLDVDRFFQDFGRCRLPQDPAIVVKGIDRELCSIFKSNAKPLRISFINADEQGPNIHVMYKMGDDMRQDMLVLQLVDIMDRIWLHEGLDLRMITYRCVSTGRKQGLVQLVPDSITLAKIQNKTGLFGPLKDSSMKKWFQNNQMASDNFLYSCAGWCIVTFLLGVCDRHNDNIMLTSAGHMFHIDFGKILGNAQMFGSIKRDRAPFIFTTEMESFITQEGQRPHRAQEFVQLCCCAYNILRRHSALIITLLELMLQAGLPELRSVEDLRYVYDRLRPHDSDIEAANYFTSKIQESLETPSVKLNFLVHAFANMTPSDLSRLGEGLTPAIAKFIKRAAVKSVRKVHKVGGRILGELGVGSESSGTVMSLPAGPPPSLTVSPYSPRSLQLHMWFSPPQLFVQLKHLRNIPPEPTLILSLYSGPREVSSQEITWPSSAPVFSQVQFMVPQLEGLVLKIQVRSSGRFLGQLLLPLSSARLRQDVWYQLEA